MTVDAGRIRDEVAEFIRHPDDRFPFLFRDLFTHQFAANAPYRAYCESLGITADRVHSWEEVPPVPADAFKTGLPLTCFPPHDACRVFQTSGTTTEARGRHYFPELDTYALSIRRGWQEAGLPELGRCLVLSPPPGTNPESSLTYMFETLAAGSSTPAWLRDPHGGLHLDLLEATAAQAEPVMLFSTALALLQLIDELRAPLPLPPGSWILQTGGYKGQFRETHPRELEALAARWLHVPPERIVNEYGMTELSSQCYAVGPDAPHRAPPWMRVRVIDPESGHALPPGEPGYIVLYDLANVGSVLAVRTQDFGRGIDDHTFQLDGRDPGALPRGCSRSNPGAIHPPARP